MPDKFTIADPNGKVVTCSEEQWNDHILANRPWMSSYEKRVQKTIEDPTAILQDAAHPDRNNYYRRYKSNYMKVVVENDNTNSAKVITAFVANSPKSSESIIWKK